MFTKPEQKDAEVRHVMSALKANGYKEWAFKIPHPKTSPTPRVTPQGARPAPAWAFLISEVHPQNWPEFSKTMELGLTTSPSTPCAPSWSTPKTRQKVWCCLWNRVSRIARPVYRCNCPHTGDKDQRPPKTKVSTNSCGRPWSSH